MARLYIWLLATLLVACDSDAPPPAATGVASVAERMSSTPDPGFTRALRPRPFSFPDDHGAHPEFATEWWYFTGHLDDHDRRFGYQLTLFRVGLRPGQAHVDSAWRANQLYMGHIAISDIVEKKHYSTERFSRAAAGLAGAENKPLRIWLGPWSIHGSAQETFPIRLAADSAQFGIELTIQRGQRPIVPQGENGLSQKSAAPGNASHYYSFTRLPTSGTLRIGTRRHQVEGQSWFDREWSTSALAPDQAGWDWFALQLDDGSDLMYYQMRGVDGKAQRFSNGILLDKDGVLHKLGVDDVVAHPTRQWRADNSVRYPLAWSLSVPEYGLDLRIDAAIDDQEFSHSVRYWEGVINVSGSHQGRGYLELSGYDVAQ